MQCPVCKDSKGAPTGTLELVSAMSVPLDKEGKLLRESVVLLDEYLACNNCSDLQCDTEDCVAWYWEQAGTDRRLKLGNPASIVTPAVVTAP